MSDALSLSPRRRDHAASLADPSPALPGRRPILYDMSHLIARLRAESGTGIDRIDLAFASHFFALTQRGEAVRYSSGAPKRIARSWARGYTSAAKGAWTQAETPDAQALWAWLESPPGSTPKPRLDGPSRLSAPAWSRRLLSWSGRLVGSARKAVPEGAVYINVGYHRFEHPRFFAWLTARPDVDGVFMIHDLLPLDYPEYFQAGESDKFRDRIATALRYGRAFLVSTEAVRRRLQQEIAAHGLEPRPIWAKPFPSPLAEFYAPTHARRAPTHPYFVIVGTIEPRKNHILLLHVWRDLASRMATPPRLVIVGARGWENEQVLDLLDRSEVLAPHVVEAPHLGSGELAELMAGACAVLAPSFAEGYGLPIVEALAVGAPVIAGDNEAAREVSQGLARYLSPIDGASWAREIERLATDAAYRQSLKQAAAGFVAPNWRDYFASLDRFIAELETAQP